MTVTQAACHSRASHDAETEGSSQLGSRGNLGLGETKDKGVKFLENGSGEL